MEGTSMHTLWYLVNYICLYMCIEKYEAAEGFGVKCCTESWTNGTTSPQRARHRSTWQRDAGMRYTCVCIPKWHLMHEQKLHSNENYAQYAHIASIILICCTISGIYLYGKLECTSLFIMHVNMWHSLWLCCVADLLCDPAHLDSSTWEGITPIRRTRKG